MLVHFFIQVDVFRDDEAYLEGRRMKGSYRVSQIYRASLQGWDESRGYRLQQLSWMLAMFLTQVADTTRRALVDGIRK